MFTCNFAWCLQLGYIIRFQSFQTSCFHIICNHSKYFSFGASEPVNQKINIFVYLSILFSSSMPPNMSSIHMLTWRFPFLHSIYLWIFAPSYSFRYGMSKCFDVCSSLLLFWTGSPFFLFTPNNKWEKKKDNCNLLTSKRKSRIFR